MLKKIDNILLLGTSHVSKLSQKQIIQTINQTNPEVIGIELDLPRLKSLLSKKNKNQKPSFPQMTKQFGFGGAIFALIANFIQTNIGKKLNIDPGIDMKTAYQIGREKKIPTSLIDLNIKITLRKFSKLSTLKKLKMGIQLLIKPLKKQNRNQLKLDINNPLKNESPIIKLLKIIEKEVPDLHKILIEDRNKYMVKKLLKLKEKHTGIILAVVGAGHVDGMYKLLKKEILYKPQTTNFQHKFTINIKK